MTITGLERLLNEPGLIDRLKGSRVGVVCHGASVNHSLRYGFDLLIAAGVDVRFLLVPEHGLFGEIPYMEKVEDFRLSHNGLPVFSLYKETADQLRPPPGLLDGIDVLLCDIQDVGSRYYTYIATMAMLMESIDGTSTRFVVLDRPNPIGGTRIEGNIPNPGLRSFVGYMPLANRHSLTAGEAALYYRHKAALDVDLDVIPCAGLTRAMTWDETGLPFVPPSPNIPEPATALVYTGMCLLEGTNLSEGRGTASPFFLAGAPWIREPWDFAAEINRRNLPGVKFRPVRFTPGFDKWQGKSCGGVHIVVDNPRTFESLLTGMTILSAAATMYPLDFAYRNEAYEFVRDRQAIDLLLGDFETSAAVRNGIDPADLYAAFATETEQFESEIAGFRLYE